MSYWTTGLRCLGAALALACIAAAPPHPYKAISMRDFQIDGPALAGGSQPVQVTGIYVKPGNMDMLYANEGDAAVGAYSGSSYAAQISFIPLLTDHASHAIREAMYDCHERNNLYCALTVRGLVTVCSVTNGFGATRQTPCLEVYDGAPYAPSTPARQSARPVPEPVAAPDADVAPGPAFEKRVRDCVQSPEMASASDVYRKCLAKELHQDPGPQSESP